LSEVLFTKVCNRRNIYLSIIERNNNIFGIVFKRVYIFFTRFRSARSNSDRYVSSRYYLIRRVQQLGIYNKFNYCFSHSGKYSAVLFSSETGHLSVDIEPVGRRLTKSLKIKVRSIYKDLILPELMVIMILETLVKLPIFDPPISLSKGIPHVGGIKTIALENNVFEINVNNVKVYSKIYTFADLHICITLESNQFDLSL